MSRTTQRRLLDVLASVACALLIASPMFADALLRP